MSFLSYLDRERRGETPDDFWFQMYEQACSEHQGMIDAEKVRCGLTLREATQKIFKCDEAYALADIIPATWSKPVFSQHVIDILDQPTMDMLVDASHADPRQFDEAIALRRFLLGPRDTQGSDRALQEL